MSYLQVHISSLSQFSVVGKSVTDHNSQNILHKKIIKDEQVSIILLDLYTTRMSSLLYFASMKQRTKNVEHVNNN